MRSGQDRLPPRALHMEGIPVRRQGASRSDSLVGHLTEQNHGTKTDHRGKTKSVSYLVQAKFPAAEVIEFYDAYFNAKGLRPSFEICQRHWDRLPDETTAGGATGKQLFTSWEHPVLHLKAVLRLEYEMVNEKWGDDLIVRCQLQPKAKKKIKS